MEGGRKHPAHPVPRELINRPIIVFLTVCSKDRKPILAFQGSAGALLHAWCEAKSWLVGRYVIMPDHIHLFCAPATVTVEPLAQWVRYWKNMASRVWPKTNEQPIWQRDFWDTQLRRDDS